jgi:exosortase/archaeosortase family protein
VAALLAGLLAEVAVRSLDHHAAPLAAAVGRCCRAMLEWLGLPVLQSGAVLSGGAFSYEIAAECLGLTPVIALCGFLWAARSPTRQRAWMVLAVGAVTLLALNLARLVSLFWLGTRDVNLFRWAHEFLWPAILLTAFLAIVHVARSHRTTSLQVNRA